MGRAAKKTTPVHAYPLDPDINPWEQQPNESQERFAQFVSYRDDDNRVQSDHASKEVGMRWSWGYRAYQYDLYMARVDEQEMVRYRRLMNFRQRHAARAAQAKVIRWLNQLDPATLRPSEAAKWFEIAMKVEREAAGAEHAASTAPAEHGYDSAASHADTSSRSLKEMLGSDEVAAAEIANMLAQLEQQGQS